MNSWGPSSPPHLGLVWELCDLQGSEACRQEPLSCLAQAVQPGSPWAMSVLQVCFAGLPAESEFPVSLKHSEPLAVPGP